MKKIDIEKLNDLSLMNIIFHTKKKLDTESMEFLNLVFAREGAFLAIKSRFGIVFDRTNLPYKNKGLHPLFDDEDVVYSFQSFIRKPDISVLQGILETFKYVCGKTNHELLTIVYYDTEEDRFITDIVRTQIITGGSVQYAYNKALEMNERFIKYLEIHSHHSMGASFSGTDNKDESNRTLYFCVLGKINPVTSNLYNIDHKFRIWSGSRFIEIPIYEVFETHTEPVKLEPEVEDQLDTIIEVSRTIRQMQQQSQTKHRSGTPALGFPPEYGSHMNNTLKEALENMGLDINDPDVLETLEENELDQLPIDWEEETDRRRPN